jgi:uncharacterized membrane protein
MNIVKKICYAITLALILTTFFSVIAQPVVFATSKDFSSSPRPYSAQTEQEEVSITTKYPALSAVAGSSYEFEIEIRYSGGTQPRVFELRATVPSGFDYQISRSYGTGANIAAVQLDPSGAYGETLKVTVAPYFWLMPMPGEHTITVEAASGNIKGSIDLKAVVTAKYELKLDTPDGLLNTKVTTGKDNYFTVHNTGTAELDKINLNQSIRGGASGWSVTFEPESIDTLAVGAEKVVQINIKPPEKTIAGDYEINVTASTQSNNSSDNLDIRVTVLTPTIWGWVGVGIVVIVVIGLIAMFWRLGRR